MEMAFADLTTELEELISKSEFENKQLVRAINQENQLFASIDHEIELKNNEIERLQTEMTQMDQEAKYHDKQFKRNKDNSENLKRTSDVLTEHVHAIQTQFEDMKIKRHEEKCAHEQQLQHFRDVWTKYKETYEKFPRVLQLRKIEGQIQANEEFIEKKAKETEDMKKAIADIEKANYWKAMDWKTFCIKLAENRVNVLGLRKEITKKKENTAALKAQQRNEDEMPAKNSSIDSNVQKTPSNELKKADDDSNMLDMEICSPMISVFCERDDDEVEVMQTDQPYVDDRRQHIDTTARSENKQLQPQVAVPLTPDVNQHLPNLPYQRSHQNMELPRKDHVTAAQQFRQTPVHVESRHDIEMSPKKQMTAAQPLQQNQVNGNSSLDDNQAPFPFASYTKTSQLDGSFKEKVNLHLTVTNNQSTMQEVPARSSHNQIRRQPEVYKPNIANSSSMQTTSTTRETSFINTSRLYTQTSQLNNIPFRPAMISGMNQPRVITAPTLSHNVGNSREKAFPLSTAMKPRQSPTIPIQAPQMNRLIHKTKQLTIPSVQIPKISFNSTASPRQTLTTSRSPVSRPNCSVPKIANSLRPTQQQVVPVSSSSQSQHEIRRPTVMQTNLSVPENCARKTVSPQMLKEQSSKVVHSFTPQPSPCPVKQPTAQEQPKQNVAKPNQSLNAESPNKPSETVSPTPKILPPGNVYYVPLKGSPQKSADQTRKRPIQKSPEGQMDVGTSSSPFNYERHRQRLAELKKSPGYDQYAAGRRMFETTVSSRNDPGTFGRDNTGGVQSPAKQPIYTSVFGGAKQPADDNTDPATPSTETETNFNFFSFGDSSGTGTGNSTFMMFGEENNQDKEQHSDGFRLNFGDNDTAGDQPGHAFSLFDNTAMDTSPTGFSLNFKGSEGNDSPARGNVLSLFGEPSDTGTPSAAGDFNLNFRKEDVNEASDRGNVLSLFGSPSVEDTPTAAGDFHLNFQKGDIDGSPDRGNVLSLFGNQSYTDESLADRNFNFNLRKGNINESPEMGNVLSLFGDPKA